jgi:GTP cyclohydrolase I
VSEINHDAAKHAVTLLLQALGHDTQREGLVDTPNRVAKFLADWSTPQPFAFTTFASEGMSEMVVQVGIPFFSLCEHHMLPFFGTAAVAYIPGERIVGLSKLARCVQHHARGLQNQERITMAVAEDLQRALSPIGVGVVLRARHLCMEMRGVRSHDTCTVTSRLTGALMEDASARSEFLALSRQEL